MASHWFCRVGDEEVGPVTFHEMAQFGVDNQAKPSRARPSGFTLVELLVVITIIGMLMALLLPAVMQARAAGRRTICKNNLHNVGLAMLGEAEAKRRFPPSGVHTLPGDPLYSWVVKLLPGLERSDIASKWDYNLLYYEGGNRELGHTTIAVLACPDDPSVVPGKGNLSYVVNAGWAWSTGSLPVQDCTVSYHAPRGPGDLKMLDLNGNGITCPADAQQDGNPSDRRLYYQLGLFFLEHKPGSPGGIRRHQTLDTVFDGLSNTIMLSENIRAGYDPKTDSNWAAAGPLYNAFFVSSYVCQDRRCSAGNVDYRRANARSEYPYRLEAINGDFNQAEAEAPWASSGHVGGVHVVFADGHIRFLEEDVDGAVYAALLSPQGTLVRGLLAQPMVADGSY